MRFGIDLGGTKTEIMALNADGSVALRRRIATPKDYDSMLRAIAELVRAADTETKTRGSVGMARRIHLSLCDWQQDQSANEITINPSSGPSDLADRIVP